MKRWTKIVIVLFCIISLMPMQVFAMETEPDIVFMTEEEAEYYASIYFPKKPASNGELSITELSIFESDGRLMVLYSTSASGSPSEVGIKQIMLEEKSGTLWEIVAKNDKQSKKDANTYTGGFYFNSPVSGYSYRASGIHFAVIDGKEITKYANTGGFIFP